MLVTQEKPRDTPSTDPSAVARLRRHVQEFSEPRHMRAQPLANTRARERIADHLVQLGYRVFLQGPYRNVVAVPHRDTAALTAVCAHYDSVPTTPGADDNGSGLAVMLEVARRAARGGNPIALIAFNAEEDWLAGSRDFVREHIASPRWPIARAHVLEMVGFTGPEQRLPILPTWLPSPIPTTGDFLGLIADGTSAAELARVLGVSKRHHDSPPIVSLRMYLGVERLIPDTGRSDHAPFWNAGIPAVLWTDTGDFRSPHYHRPSDLPDTLDYAFMSRVANLLTDVCCG